MKNAKTFNIYKTYTFSLICHLGSGERGIKRFFFPASFPPIDYKTRS